jgi:hypothetical protein
MSNVAWMLCVMYSASVSWKGQKWRTMKNELSITGDRLMVVEQTVILIRRRRRRAFRAKNYATTKRKQRNDTNKATANTTTQHKPLQTPHEQPASLQPWRLINMSGSTSRRRRNSMKHRKRPNQARYSLKKCL